MKRSSLLVLGLLVLCKKKWGNDSQDFAVLYWARLLWWGGRGPDSDRADFLQRGQRGVCWTQSKMHEKWNLFELETPVVMLSVLLYCVLNPGHIFPGWVTTKISPFPSHPWYLWPHGSTDALSPCASSSRQMQHSDDSNSDSDRLASALAAAYNSGGERDQIWLPITAEASVIRFGCL